MNRPSLVLVSTKLLDAIATKQSTLEWDLARNVRALDAALNKIRQLENRLAFTRKQHKQVNPGDSPQTNNNEGSNTQPREQAVKAN